MDARPQRLRGFQPLADENVPPAAASTGHQRKKSIGTTTMLGGLNAAAKRTAFADVSNTAKNQAAASQVNTKKGTKNGAIAGGLANGAGKDAFRRPAQRPQKPLAVIENSQKPAPARETAVRYDAEKTSAVGAGPKKNAVMIYKDSAQVQDQVKDHPEETKRNASTASVQAVRHYKSQPQLKPQPPVLRRTQSRLGDVSSERQQEALVSMGDLTDALYEDAQEHINLDEESYENASKAKGAALPIAPTVTHSHPAVTVDPAALYPEERLPATSATLISEPGEYWDEEEEEEEVYDEHGYTTAHSIRFRGDLTTGGVTTLPYPKITVKTLRELEAARDYVEATRLPYDQAEDARDLSMAAEYQDEIFQYMREMENKLLPNPHYMDIQTEIQWSMRSVLMDWLVQVHQRFNLLPETLFIAVNYIDRFLSCKVVSLGKLQLVGATAILLASKYEEINCPSLQEIVYMVDQGYTTEEVMKAERFMLTMLRWELGWPGPMSFLRRISKADDYDHEVRTLAKYLIEVTIMDERFVGSPASFIAAGAHCLSRLLLGKGNWSPAHIYYSGYTWGQLRDLVSMILDCCQVPLQHHAAVFEKYGDKRFKYCSEFVQEEIQSGFTLEGLHPHAAPPAPPAHARHDDGSYDAAHHLRGPEE